ncbi:MAG: peptidase M14, partial [Microvirga sp.]
MTILLDARISRTLATLLADYGSGDRHGAVLEAWLFEDQAARREAEIRLARAGVRTRLHSAYKPLVHAFLEEIPTTGLERAVIRYPVHPGAAPLRFLSEAYPLAALLDGTRVTFEAGDADLSYQ